MITRPASAARPAPSHDISLIFHEFICRGTDFHVNNNYASMRNLKMSYRLASRSARHVSV